MNKNLKNVLKAAVVTGFMAGTVAKADNHESKAATPAGEGDAAVAEKNSCKGKDSCKHKGKCKGQAHAKDKNSCKGEHKNACKGKGGCEGKATAEGKTEEKK